MKLEAFFFVLQVLSFRHTKQTTKNVVYIAFNYCVAVPLQTSGHAVYVWSEGHREPHNKAGSLSPA